MEIRWKKTTYSYATFYDYGPWMIGDWHDPDVHESEWRVWLNVGKQGKLKRPFATVDKAKAFVRRTLERSLKEIQDAA